MQSHGQGSPCYILVNHLLSPVGKPHGVSQLHSGSCSVGPHTSPLPLPQKATSSSQYGTEISWFPFFLLLSTTPVVARPCTSNQCLQEWHYLICRLRDHDPRPDFICTSVPGNFGCLSCSPRSFCSSGRCQFASTWRARELYGASNIRGPLLEILFAVFDAFFDLDHRHQLHLTVQYQPG